MKTALVVLLSAMCVALGAETLRGRVVHVADGDTVTVLAEGGEQHKVRLNRIDAPEKKT